LVNAVYFKADWQKIFGVEKTKSKPFTLSNGEQKPVKLMNVEEGFRYAESEELGGAQVLELPYKQGETSMVIILPKKESNIQSLETRLTPAALEAALSELSRKVVNVFLPKFKVVASYNLVDTLKSIGIKKAFKDDAEFPQISQQDLKISKVVHKVFVEVDEKGTEAAAATAVEFTSRSMPEAPEKPKLFVADRPFLFLIRHKKQHATLFIGRISDPTVEK